MNLETEAPKLTKRNALERRVAGWPPLTSNLSVIQQHRSRKCPGRNPPRLWNTKDPKIKNTLFRLLDEERGNDERAIIRLGLEFRHVLPARQQVLLVRDARELGLVM